MKKSGPPGADAYIELDPVVAVPVAVVISVARARPASAVMDGASPTVPPSLSNTCSAGTPCVGEAIASR